MTEREVKRKRMGSQTGTNYLLFLHKFCNFLLNIFYILFFLHHLLANNSRHYNYYIYLLNNHKLSIFHLYQ